MRVTASLPLSPEHRRRPRCRFAAAVVHSLTATFRRSTAKAGRQMLWSVRLNCLVMGRRSANPEQGRRPRRSLRRSVHNARHAPSRPDDGLGSSAALRARSQLRARESEPNGSSKGRTSTMRSETRGIKTTSTRYRTWPSSWPPTVRMAHLHRRSREIAVARTRKYRIAAALSPTASNWFRQRAHGELQKVAGGRDDLETTGARNPLDFRKKPIRRPRNVSSITA
ncbi:hypothetical protein HPB51_014516 [Rhipicephalus microplus]|uniref:Uncharacterized protein n=1 Tax=Rhipicephalus microplus TaxID=6941 RepID=A0A9J6EH30_RHIMP|nr:hypothetical protein HPB51_014516 [Rhipicephalus microplus]